ncbi:bacillithiol biosynthesis cysteine-adding enzyme BshC [Evansella tamaricis]|uniref:Putative cysteine ligase BshC n=1 Tax=Evansella tamaricis TaxID=2069301 RepID=A0ABS6JFF5_9BACI|nr:bacillithiol biosynthesis cysteine-adding enzyme BshC [Evansella tamaricis]MBU9712412.1 bacillithiol biosynthesis cysteine-adding enzyme BshC [Evansella tamaricis]
MKLVSKDLNDPQSFISKYINEDKLLMDFYDYSLSIEDLHKRYGELSNRNYQRAELVVALTDYNKKYTSSEKTFSQINRLLSDDTVVLVGGQQTGVLSGPIYTPNKIISILHYAETMEQQLNKPVIPIFWLAGEDHDVDEINHTYVHHGSYVKKVRILERNDIKTPASERKIPRAEALEMIKTMFRSLRETEQTPELYQSLVRDLDKELTYVDWCSLILHRLFKDTGIILMDAHDPQIRALEKPYFKDMIKKNNIIREEFLSGANRFKLAGFGEPIEMDEVNAHLFFHEQKQRFLLESSGNIFKEKNGIRSWETLDLLRLFDDDQIELSNNVVTRPIMQDLLLPVIGFMAGPGELKYWGTLQKVFHTFQIKMPPIIPRLHISFVSRRTKKNLFWIGVNPDTVSQRGVQDLKEEWIVKNKSTDIQDSFVVVNKTVEDIFLKLGTTIDPFGEEGKNIHHKYKKIVQDQFAQFERKLDDLIVGQLTHGTRRFDEVEAELFPDGNLQERYLNIYPFLNEYSTDLLQRVVKELRPTMDLKGKHLYIYL